MLQQVLRQHAPVSSDECCSRLGPSCPPCPPLPQEPSCQAVVEVACGLEALADTLALALDAGDGKRAARYSRHAAALVSFLDAAQVAPGEDVPPQAVGGWGHRLQLSTQRIDVTG